MSDYEAALRVADALVRENGFDALAVPAPVRTVYLIGQLDFELTSGGVVQWITNRSGRYARETAHALSEVGATKCSDLLGEILAILSQDGASVDDETRVKQVMEALPMIETEWRRLGEELLEWPDDIDTLLRKYVAENISFFQTQ